MTPAIKFGLIALIVFSAGAAVYVSVLIGRRQDLPSDARRAFLLSNVSLIFCLAAFIFGVSIYSRNNFWGGFLLGMAGAFLILKFVLVRQFAHRIRSGVANSSQATAAPSKRT